MPAVSILSIQSLVAYGHAGNSAALFPLQRLGRVVWPVMTVHFSNHTGYGDWRGPLLSADDVAEVIRGVEDRGAFERCEAVLSGYQGAEDVGAVILDAVARVKTANPDAIYCCDPVMGDVGRGMFVRPGIPEFMREQVVPAADVITPNHFELDFLAGTTTTTVPALLDAVAAVRATGPTTVLVTSVVVEDTPEDALDMVAVDDRAAWRVRFPRLAVSPPGAGDLTASVFLANLLDGHALGDALARTASSVFAV
ncbi:MAG: pyridoxal kinase PdxY, partial [Nocardioides sp.]